MNLPIRGRYQLLLCFIFGAIGVLGLAPFRLSFFSTLALMGFFLFTIYSPSPKRSALHGWTWGLGYFIATTHWTYLSLVDHGGMPAWLGALAVFLFSGYLALFPALASYLSRKLPLPVAIQLIMAAPAIWTLSEWLRGTLFTGFPWAAVGYSQAPTGLLSPWFPLVGVYGVGYLLAVFAACVVWIAANLWGKNRKGIATSALITAASCTIVILISQFLSTIEWTRPFGKPLHVSLVQGAIAQDLKWDPKRFNDTLARYLQLTHQAQGRLVVLPETAFPVFLEELPKEYLEALTKTPKARGADLLIGAARKNTEARGYFNSAILISENNLPHYNKQHLVPFGEFIPMKWAIGWIYRSMLNMPLDDFSAGSKTQPAMMVADQRLMPNICYEDVFGEEIATVSANATILVNLSNLAWFDGSIALEQHGQISQARTLETGKPMIRATNSGMTVAIDQHGHYQGRLPERIPAILESEVQGRAGLTPYLHLKNLPILAWCLLMLGLGYIRTYAKRLPGKTSHTI